MSGPRPFYLVAHRVNDYQDIPEAIRRGANAIECDVREGVVDHDTTWGAPTRLKTWLVAASNAADKYPELALIYFDVKEAQALEQIVEAVRTSPLGASGVAKLYSVPTLEDSKAFRSIRLVKGEGFAIDGHSDPQEVADVFAALDRPPAWYGNGIAGPLPLFSSHMESIELAVHMRNYSKRPPFSKVAVWTLRRQVSMREFISLGVDAILVNPGELDELSEVVDESAAVRRATRQDPAFKPRF